MTRLSAMKSPSFIIRLWNRAKSGRLMLFVVIAVLVVTGFVTIPRVLEPEYEGVRRSEWAHRLYRNVTQENVAAFVQMKAPGIRYLIREAVSEKRLVANLIRSLPGKMREFVKTPLSHEVKITNATLAFTQMQDDFAPFVRDLDTWLKSSHDTAVICALKLLRYFPEEAGVHEEQVLQLFQAREDLFQSAVLALKMMGADASLMIPTIMARFHADLYSVRLAAIREAHKLNMKPGLLVTPLETVLKKGTFNNGFSALGIIVSLGEAGKPLEPAIHEFLSTIPDYINIPDGLPERALAAINGTLPPENKSDNSGSPQIISIPHQKSPQE